ncbi:Transcriptional regulator, AbiEi antitoxin, Type IV TA system [compost metagenome]
MSENSRYQILKQLMADLPRGVPFDLATLGQVGVSPQLAARHAKSGWLERLAQGVYAFPNDTLDRHRTLLFLQKRVPGLHVGGKSALALQGVRHYLNNRERLVLWGDASFTLPDWFVKRFPARYVHAQLFDWQNTELPGKTLLTPPGLPDGLHVATQERAVLELLYEAGTKESLDEARNLFDGLRSPRRELLGQLLSCCTSVKTVRLFLTWARETGVVNVEELLKNHNVHTGSDKRWISRMADGTLLRLNPHG